MSLTPVWLFIAASIAVTLLIAFPLRLDMARLAILSRVRTASGEASQSLGGTSRTLILAAAAFVVVAGIGAVISYVGSPTKAPGSGSLSHYDLKDEAVERLKHYTGSVGSDKPSSKPADGKPLPDVNTMIDKLAARLKTAPGDLKGWRMLGWSYFHTGRYKEAASALAKAVELDPGSAELKLAYEEAKAKASGTTSGVAKGNDAPGGEKKTTSEATAPPEHDAIRAMVDGLAARLESSPRDVEGWMRLMRSRVVLGEVDVAARAFHKALEIFKDDASASGKISAAASELGLKAE
jgi:cytochrome c-type biogenesis protein CcmH